MERESWGQIGEGTFIKCSYFKDPWFNFQGNNHELDQSFASVKREQSYNNKVPISEVEGILMPTKEVQKTTKIEVARKQGEIEQKMAFFEKGRQREFMKSE